MALEALSRQYELDSSKELWLFRAISKLSISKLNDFFSFFIFIFSYRHHGERQNIVVETNRISKKFYYRYTVVPSKMNVFNGVVLDSRLDFDYDYLLEKTVLMFYLVRNQKQREKFLADWLFSWDEKENKDIELLLRHSDDRSKIFSTAMADAQRLLETWETLEKWKALDVLD